MKYFLILCLVASAHAEDLYIAQSAQGTGNASSPANAAAAYSFFNTASNWDGLVDTTNGKIGPGDTVHITGIINATGSTATSANQLQFQRGGVPGNPITLKFDVGGRLRHPDQLFNWSRDRSWGHHS